MSALQHLRTRPHLAQAVALWFALFLLLSIASSWLRPVPSHMVCVSGMGMQWLQDPQDAGSDLAQAMGQDCPLCASPVALPLGSAPAIWVQPSLPHVALPAPLFAPALLARAALPARGPPAQI